MSGSRWTDDPGVPRGATYDAGFERLAASGADVHGEATLVAALSPGRRVLDAGCGTGRVAIELARRGFAVTGVDLDPAMLAAAREKAPDLDWHQSDLAAFRTDERYDLAVLAGNVLIFVDPGTEAAVVAATAATLQPRGLLVAGFTVRGDGYGPADLDRDAAAAGLALVDRWSTWDRGPWHPGDRYQVSVHART
ncbi:class I SAM-dependent methyltransferase [Aquihabitans sp. G128]|uniref:class I SAM-dependent methyltransferase n=1 Tax=Aquihabitans sp. G128 TaxID=2849779 RepID=UPI001C247E79|nr:class I SAM-dependent methyltransferase [Aquihabitans sp. G128]QXC62582.1 class I SAM-dependent methyltransferase [Aquihabitans sp. G128]